MVMTSAPFREAHRQGGTPLLQNVNLQALAEQLIGLGFANDAYAALRVLEALGLPRSVPLKREELRDEPHINIQFC